MDWKDDDLKAHLRAGENEPQLRNTLDTLGREHFGKRPTGRIRKLWPYLLATAAIGLLLLFALPGTLAPAEAQYSDFASHQPLSLTERGEGDNEALTAQVDFNGGKYAAAIPNLSRYLSYNPEDQHARLALGIAYLETDNFAAARSAFTQITQADNELSDFGYWYLALTELKIGNSDGVTPYLDRVSEDNEYLQRQISELRAGT